MFQHLSFLQRCWLKFWSFETLGIFTQQCCTWCCACGQTGF